MDLTTSYFGIEKADRNADGTLTVYGKATDDSIDIDQQICDSDWLDRAMPAWFKSGGNIREQHSSIAAGVAKEYESKADGHYISALVVDPVSVKKVETGVLKGFSIGIKNPRVTRDKAASNGRIIDGQIVEVSLVDRPANPNCQLMLAKSADGQESLVQVEDLIETNGLQSESNLKEKSAMEKAKEIIDLSKGYKSDLVKFDKGVYDAARTALANLIAIEANEMAEDNNNEEMSLAHLLEAVHHLFAWYEGEKAEGEVPEEVIEMAADPEVVEASEEKAADDEKMCKECGKSEKMCKCSKEADADKSADANKCLECGCHSPETTHGLTDVTTADMVSPDETPKSAEPTEVVAELEDQELPEETKENSDDDKSADIEAIVEQVVDSATKALKSEIASLVAAKEAAQEKAVGLEAELSIAKSLAVAGGPRRTAKPVGETSNDLLIKAATYKAKAAATTDPTLAKGYKLLADKFIAEADKDLNK